MKTNRIQIMKIWTQVNTVNTYLLQNVSGDPIMVYLTDDDVQPTDNFGMILQNNEAISSYETNGSNIWVKSMSNTGTVIISE